MEFSVIRGDIAEQSADALVNAAGTSLGMGSGVAGALRRAAGRELDRAAVSTGSIGVTPPRRRRRPTVPAGGRGV
jgi:O-acetyl-ADP-ribose deacetylase (regulator of RNase III)